MKGNTEQTVPVKPASSKEMKCRMHLPAVFPKKKMVSFNFVKRSIIVHEGVDQKPYFHPQISSSHFSSLPNVDWRGTFHFYLLERIHMDIFFFKSALHFQTCSKSHPKKKKKRTCSKTEKLRVNIQKYHELNKKKEKKINIQPSNYQFKSNLEKVNITSISLRYIF